MSIRSFIDKHYHHFNAATVKDASRAYLQHIDNGGLMLVTLAGAMSTAELGISLAEMIRQKKVHAICCTGANLEEDLFHLVASPFYKRIPEYRYLTKKDDQELLEQHCNRVTDTCIPEEEAMRYIEEHISKLWLRDSSEGIRKFPHEYFYELINSKVLEKEYKKPKETSWLVAAAERNLPLFVPGWEDSTLGNMYAGRLLQGILKEGVLKHGLEYMVSLANWYVDQANRHPEYLNHASIGFFQIGGGIAGDFPICVVPMLTQDLEIKNTPLWGYFCQISDSTTSYGSYSGATPNEKITWGKLHKDTPMFVIESDATIVAPLIFEYILNN